MASTQAKITSFYRPTKPNSSAAAAAKRRKAVIEEPDSLVQKPIETKPIAVLTEKAPLTVPELPFLLTTDFAKLSGTQSSSDVKVFSAPTEVGQVVQKTTRVRKTKKMEGSVSKSRRVKTGKGATTVEAVKEETTSYEDNHGTNPAEKVSTPKASTDSSTSTRKRKMQSTQVQGDSHSHTPEKVEKKEDIQRPATARKKLEMGMEHKPVESARRQPTLVNSPVKQVQFLCLGSLSPKKPELVSPLKALKSPLLSTRHLGSGEKRISELAASGMKSPAVKSLASLLDKVPTASAPARLSAEEVKSRLGQSKNLAELRAKLAKVNDCSAKVKEFYANQVQLKKFNPGEFNIEVPISPHKSPLKQSPVKRQVEKRPAFERFHALAQPPSSHLCLPYKYKVLNEIFRCLETVVTMLHNRKECIYFSKIKPAVQKMLQKDFTEKHLAQVCHVFPSAYRVSYEKQMTNLTSSPLKNRGIQLSLAPRLNYLSPQLFDEEETNENMEAHKGFQPIGPTMLVERRYIFHNRLVKLVKEHHSAFLAEYNPLLNVPEDKVTRWHQNFDVDSVPDVPVADLPKPPEIKTFATAKDVLEQAQSLIHINPRLEAALKERASLRDEQAKSEKDTAEQESKKPEAPANAGLKGVSQSLIDKIRAREAAKAQKQMTMNTEEIRRQGMAKMLPELARIINSIFVTEKKSVLPIKDLIDRIQYSHRSIMSASAVEEHIKLLRSVYPEWVGILSRGTVDYVKVDRNIDSNIVYQKLEDNAKY